MIGIEALPHAAEQDRDPDEQAKRKKNLPESSEIEILEPLRAEPDPKIAQVPLNARIFPGEASENDQSERAQQAVREDVLSARLVSRDHRHEKNPCCEI